MKATCNSSKTEFELPAGWRWVKLGEVCEEALLIEIVNNLIKQ